MNRLQKECLAASLVMHTLLLVMLVVGSGFLARKPAETEFVTMLDFIPDRLVDTPDMGGGSPQTAPPAAAPKPTPPDPLPPAPQPPIVKPAKDTPPPAVEKERSAPVVEKTKPTPSLKPVVKDTPPPLKESRDAIEPAPPKKKIEISLKPVVRSDEQLKAERARAEAAAAERERTAREEQARRAAEVRQARVGNAVGAIQNKISSSTAVTVVGTGGATYASYTQFVDLVYRRTWASLKPNDTPDRSAVVVARVVIAKDGGVISSEITRRSGNAALDASVRRTLEQVRTIGRPFPEGATDTQREFNIEFNLEASGGA